VLLDAIVACITADETTWLNVMMSAELQLEPVDTQDVLRTSVTVTIASIIGWLHTVHPY